MSNFFSKNELCAPWHKRGEMAHDEYHDYCFVDRSLDCSASEEVSSVEAVYTKITVIIISSKENCFFQCFRHPETRLKKRNSVFVFAKAFLSF